MIINKTFTTNEGYEVKIVTFINNKKVVVEYPCGYQKEVYYVNLKRGEVSYPYHRKVYNKGFLGEGTYRASEKGTHTKNYKIWKGMLRRCYDEKTHNTCPTYFDCEVEEQWLNFQNFSEWFLNNPYSYHGYELDKDILQKGNRIYSPQLCIMIPREINSLVKRNTSSNKDLPLGVSWDKVNNKYVSQCMFKKKNKKLGRYATKEEAFYAYKNYKEEIIKEVANKWKEKIDPLAYDALLKYTVDISD